VAGCIGFGSEGGDFPSQPITIICPYGTGGVADTEARTMASAITAGYDVDVAVENIPGAGTLKAKGEIRDAEPDGYTVCQSYLPSFVVTFLTQEPGWDPRDLTGIAQYRNYEAGLIAHEDTGIHVAENPFEELFKRYQESDEYSSVGGLGRGHSWHLQLALLREEFGYAWDSFVNYDEGGPMIVRAVSEKEVESAMNSLRHTLPLHESDESPIKLLGTTASESVDYPDVPTWTDYGFDPIDFIAKFTIQFVGPPDLPEERVRDWEEIVETISESDEIVEYAEDQGTSYELRAGGAEVDERIASAYEQIPEEIPMDELEM
jgi:tripartite-type tricarboxylate transporter receptor subunit TctC